MMLFGEWAFQGWHFVVHVECGNFVSTWGCKNCAWFCTSTCGKMACFYLEELSNNHTVLKWRRVAGHEFIISMGCRRILSRRIG